LPGHVRFGGMSHLGVVPGTKTNLRSLVAMAKDKPRSKSDILNALGEMTELSRKEVSAVLDSLEDLIEKDLTKGCGIFNLPGMLKIYVHHKAATKARPGRNPATGEEIMISAKPASKVVKVRALKKLKEMI